MISIPELESALINELREQWPEAIVEKLEENASFSAHLGPDQILYSRAMKSGSPILMAYDLVRHVKPWVSNPKKIGFYDLVHDRVGEKHEGVQARFLVEEA